MNKEMHELRFVAQGFTFLAQDWLTKGQPIAALNRVWHQLASVETQQI